MPFFPKNPREGRPGIPVGVGASEDHATLADMTMGISEFIARTEDIARRTRIAFNLVTGCDCETSQDCIDFAQDHIDLVPNLIRQQEAGWTEHLETKLAELIRKHQTEKMVTLLVGFCIGGSLIGVLWLCFQNLK